MTTDKIWNEPPGSIEFDAGAPAQCEQRLAPLS
jgi:hypothetical protein